MWLQEFTLLFLLLFLIMVAFGGGNSRWGGAYRGPGNLVGMILTVLLVILVVRVVRGAGA